jgi:hypothetical protein
MSYEVHRSNYDSHSIQPLRQVHRYREDRYDEEDRYDRRRDPPRVTIIDNEEDNYDIPGHDGRRDSSRVIRDNEEDRYGRRDSSRVIRDNDGGHRNIRGREREAEPTYLNAQNTASKYYEGGFGDRAWRKKKLERIGRGHPPRIDPKQKPPRSSK